MQKLLACVGLLVLAACKAERASPGSTTATSSVVVVDPLAAVRAKLPKDGAKLVNFELARVPSEDRGERGGTYVFVRPVGWEESSLLHGRTHKPKAVDLGFRTALAVESECNGVCAAKDWAREIDANLKKSYPDSPTTHDETLPDGRRIRWQVIDGKQAWFRAAWFTPGAPFYYSCSGSLDDPRLLPYLDAFLEICRTAHVEKK